MIPSAAALPAPVLGALWYVAALSCWGVSAGIIRYAAADMPTLEIGFFRALFGALLTLPWLLRARVYPVPRRHVGLYLLRGALETVAIATWFIALGYMQAADVVALGFTAPIFTTLLGAMLLGERIRLRRSLAIAVGLAGALLVIKPVNLIAGEGVGWIALLPVFGSIAVAGSRIAGRRLAQTEPTIVIVASLGFITTPMLLPAAAAIWQPVTLYPLALALGIACLSLIGHVFMVLALAKAPVSALAPYESAQMLTAVAFGIAVLGEWPDLWTWVGSAVILGVAIYIIRREAQLARRKQEAA
jgi:drug/metabolite transporter (DMT)-like permease